MEVDNNELKLLNAAIEEWEKSGRLSPEKAGELRNSMELKQTARHQIAQYFFFIALFCTLLAFGALFINEKLLEKLKVYFSLSDLVIALISAGLSVAWFLYFTRKRRQISPAAYEIYMVLGGLSVLTSLVYFCKEMGVYATYTTFLLFSFLALMVLSPLCRSKALWIGALAAATAWFGTYTTLQGYDNLFLGMNYPMRYAVFGAVLLGIGVAQPFIKPLAFTGRITFTAGLGVFFCALWGISIFGNYNTLIGWHAVRQVYVLPYAIVFAIAAAASFFLGIKFKNDIARDFGILFLLINGYTRYFEYFWDAMNKGIFFAVLAVAFGLTGWLLARKGGKAGQEQATAS